MYQRWTIVGYRHFTDQKFFETAMTNLMHQYGVPSMIVSGGASGADTLAHNFAVKHNIPTQIYHPASYTRDALLARNTLIVNDADLVVAFLSPASRGTWDTINKANRAGKKLVIIDIP